MLLPKKEAFKENEIIESVTFPDSLEIIGEMAFKGCSSLCEVELNDGLKNIGWDAFRGTGLSQVRIPYSVNKIGCSAFNCDIEVDDASTDFCAYDGVLYSFNEDQLVIYPTDKEDEEYEVPLTVKEINSFAFEDTHLMKLTLPDSINYLGRDIFSSESKLGTLVMEVADPNDIVIDKNVFETFNKKQCRLIVPDGSISIYASNKHFKDFFSIREACSEDIESDEEFIPGQCFKTLPGNYLTDGKSFFNFEGCDHCYVVMTTKGFFLKVMDGGYFYFMSELLEESRKGRIWVKNKRGRAVSYEVTYTIDNVKDTPFGSFTEFLSERTIFYKDIKTGKSFMLNIKTGKVVK